MRREFSSLSCTAVVTSVSPDSVIGGPHSPAATEARSTLTGLSSELCVRS